MNEPITVHRHWHEDTGTYTCTVDQWPRQTIFDAVLLEDAKRRGWDAEVLSTDGDMVTITVENGQAVYQLDRDAITSNSTVIPAYLVSSRLSAAER